MQVTQKNLYNLIPPKAAKITAMLKKKRNMALKQALLTFYSSNAYKLLEREETKLWHASPAQIFAEHLARKTFSGSFLLILSISFLTSGMLAGTFSRSFITT